MVLRSAIAAFSMYSRIPMPRVEWNEKTTRWLFCWFPAVGLVIGAACALLLFLLEKIGCGSILIGVLLTAVPLLVTGGIHMDGFMDTVDARASCADRGKKLEILKDPHAGAFAVIFSGVYLFVTAGAWSEITWHGMKLMIFVFALERACSALLALYLPDARRAGSLTQLKGGTPRSRSQVILAAEALALTVGMLLTEWRLALPSLAAAAVTCWYYRRMAIKEFGGTTGDLAGWFLQTCELVMLLTIVIAGKLLGLSA